MKCLVEFDGLIGAIATSIRTTHETDLRLALVYTDGQVPGLRLSDEQTTRAIELFAIAAVKACLASTSAVVVDAPKPPAPKLVSVPMPEGK